MPELTPEQKAQLDRNIRNMLASGASEQDVISYTNDFKNKYDVEKKNQVGSVLKTGTENISPSKSTLPSGLGLSERELIGTNTAILTKSQEPEVSVSPYNGIILATQNAPIEKQQSIYREAVTNKNLQPLVDYVNEEKETFKKKKNEADEIKKEEARGDLTGASDLILATQTPETDEVVEADNAYIKSLQKNAASAIDAIMAEKFLDKKGAEKLFAAKDLGKERRALRSAIGEEAGFKDEIGGEGYIARNLKNKEDSELKLSGLITINTREHQQVHDYKNEFGIYATTLARLENDLGELYGGNENVRKFYDVSSGKEAPMSEEEAQELLKDSDVTAFRQKLGTYDLLGERLAQLPQSYPYVKWELDRSKIADKFAEMVHNENVVSDLTGGIGSLRRLRQLFVGDRPDTESEIQTLSKETGISEDRVREVIETYGDESRGAYVPSTFGKVLRGGTNVVNNTIQGLAREFVDTDKANLINKQLDKANYNIPAAVKKDWSVDRIIDTMANGLGQFAGFVTVARLGGAPFEAVAGLSETASVVNSIQKANSIGSTFATGFLASYEDAYQYAATQTDDESKRKAYADGVAGFNGVSELLLRDVDVANKILKGKSATRILDEFAAKRTPFTAGDVFKARAGEFAKVLGYESAEELVPYFGEAFLKDNIFGNKTSTAELMKGALNTVIETAISTIPMGGFSATSVPTTKVMEAALLEAAKTPDIFTNRWNEMYDKGAISGDVRDKNIKVVNTLADIYSKLPNAIPGAKQFNEEEKAALVHKIFAKRQLEAEKQNLDESFHPAIDEEIKIKDEQAKAIINGSPATVAAAVIEVGGKMYEGKNHAEAILKAREAGEDVSGINRQADGKFKLSNGTIVDRSQVKKQFGQDRSELLIEQDDAAKRANEDLAALSKPAQPSLAERVRSVLSVPKSEAESEVLMAEGFKNSSDDDVMKYATDQAIDAPESLLSKLGGDRELTTDLIAQKPEGEIEQAKTRWRQKTKDLADDAPDETILTVRGNVKRAVALLEEGLAKKQKPQPIKTEATSQLPKGEEQVAQQSSAAVIQPATQPQSIETRRGITVMTPQTEVDKMVNRISKGEDLSSPEDLEFYQNNATEIESRLRERLKEEAEEEVVIPTPEETERTRISDALFAFADKILKADITGSGGGAAMTNLFKIPQEVLGRAIQAVAVAVKGGELFTDAIKKGIDIIRGEGHQVNEDDFTGLVNSLSRGEKPKAGKVRAPSIAIDAAVQSDKEYSEAMDGNEPSDPIAAYHMTRAPEITKMFGADKTQQNVFDSAPSEERFRAQMEMLQDGKALMAAAQSMFGSADVNVYGRQLFAYINRMKEQDAGLTNKRAVMLATLLGEIKQAILTNKTPEIQGELQQLDRVVGAYYNKFMHVTAKNLSAARLLRLFRDKYMADIFHDKILEEQQIRERNAMTEDEADVDISDEDIVAHQEKPRQKPDANDQQKRRAQKQADADQRKKSPKNEFERIAFEKEDDIKKKYGGKNKLVEAIIEKIKKLNCK